MILSFNFITTQEVFISAKITLIFIYLSAVQSYDVQNQQTHTFSVLLMLDLLTCEKSSDLKQPSGYYFGVTIN